MNATQLATDDWQTSVHSIPSAPGQVAAAAEEQDSTLQSAKNAQPEDVDMGRVIDAAGVGHSEQEATLPSVAQAPPASTLPVTAAAPQVPPAPSVTTSAPPTRPSSIPPSASAAPDNAYQHGSSTRVYLNQKVTPHLLEGMKHLAAVEPEKPLKWLSEFLARRSAETEGEGS